VLRECFRVLRPAGRLTGYVIHTPPGLTADEEARAAELGPAQVTGPADPCTLARQAGFLVEEAEGVTSDFLATCRAFLAARRELEEDLRREEGDAAYEEEQAAKEGMVQGIKSNLLVRSLITCTKATCRVRGVAR
jgi:hypothetical protein